MKVWKKGKTLGYVRGLLSLSELILHSESWGRRKKESKRSPQEFSWVKFILSEMQKTLITAQRNFSQMLWSPEHSTEDSCHPVLSSLFQGLGTAAVLMGLTLVAATHWLQWLVDMGLPESFGILWQSKIRDLEMTICMLHCRKTHAGKTPFFVLILFNLLWDLLLINWVKQSGMILCSYKLMKFSAYSSACKSSSNMI